MSGGSGALGRPIAEHFAASGHRVLAIDLAEPPASEGASANIVVRAVDATDRTEIKRIIAEVVPAGERIELLVNAVGLIWNEPLVSFRAGAFHAHGVESWRAAIEANLTAPFVVATTVAAMMIRVRAGAIVNFSSIAARGHVGQAAYAAAKAGIEGLTRVMASELGPFGIRVNAIAPGFIDVPSTRAAVPAGQLAAIVDRTPSRRLGDIDDIIRAVEFLAAAPFVNGSVLDVNGGLRL